MEKYLKGIAFILFGMLLCFSGSEINNTLLRSLTDLPFSLIGLISGIVGMVLIFKNETE